MAVSPRIARLLAHEPVIDGHNDLPWEARALADYDWDLLDLADTGTRTQTDFGSTVRDSIRDTLRDVRNTLGTLGSPNTRPQPGSGTSGTDIEQQNELILHPAEPDATLLPDGDYDILMIPRFAGMPFEVAERTLKTFAEKVVPELRSWNTARTRAA